MATVQKISTCLWFDKQAEEAADFYVSIFKDARIVRKAYYGKEGQETHKMPEGMVLTVEFELNGHTFVALNGGPGFKFNEAVSVVVNCTTQEEIDYYWDKLKEGGDERAQQCGWLKDKYGLSWQISPIMLDDILARGVTEASERTMKVMMQMKKLDIAQLQAAYDGK